MHDRDLRTGGCQCGRFRYEFDAAEVRTLYVCHCRECQKQSGGAFGMSLRLPEAALVTVRGRLAGYSRPAASGGEVHCRFCPRCGTRVYHASGRGGGLISLKPGTLDDTSWLRPVGHLWTRRAQPWVEIAADMLRYPGQPDDDDALIAHYTRRVHGRDPHEDEAR